MFRRFLTALLSAAIAATTMIEPVAAHPQSCQLITPTDIQAVLHMTVPRGYQGKTGETPDSNVCFYGGAAEIFVLRGDSTKYDTIVQNDAKYGSVTPVSGIGEKAAFVAHGALLVLAKQYIFRVLVVAHVPDSPQNRNEAEDLARRALARL